MGRSCCWITARATGSGDSWFSRAATSYGAFAENPYRLDEDAPLAASRSYPEIRDLVEVDTLASAFIWRCPEVTTSVLRPVKVLGPSMQSLARDYLAQARVPTVLGFNPMMQFIHEEDLAAAVATTLERGLRGVYNVVGPGEVPVHTAIEETGGTAWPLPDPTGSLGVRSSVPLGGPAVSSWAPGLPEIPRLARGRALRRGDRLSLQVRSLGDLR